MLLVMAIIRWCALRDSQSLQFRYHIVGRSRALHRTAKLLCCAVAAVPLLQVNGRLAEVMVKDNARPIAPFEIMGAPPRASQCKHMLLCLIAMRMLPTCMRAITFVGR